MSPRRTGPSAKPATTTKPKAKKPARRKADPVKQWASYLRRYRPGLQRYVERWLPSAEHILLEGCGHVPQVERPEHTNGLIERFFSRIDALGGGSTLRAA